jgi:hypothetical protein
MKSNKETLPDAKADAKAIRSYFEKVYPDMDFERVYGSDMKKMVKWFEILTNNKIEIKLSEAGDEEAATDLPAGKKAAAASKIATKTNALKSAPPKKINSPRKMA